MNHKRLLALLHCNTIRKQLVAADYIIGDTAIERKTSSDFCQTVFEKRLFIQLLKMKEKYKNAVLVIEGFLEPHMFSHSKFF